MVQIHGGERGRSAERDFAGEPRPGDGLERPLLSRAELRRRARLRPSLRSRFQATFSFRAPARAGARPGRLRRPGSGQAPARSGLDQLLQHFPNALGIVPVHVYPNATAIAGKDLESPAPNSHTRELRQGSRSCHQGDAARDRRRSGSPSVLAQRHLVDQLGDRQVELAGLADLPAAHADDEAAGVGESRGLSPGRRRAASGACPRSSRRRPSARAPRGPASRRCRRPSRPRRRPPGTRRRAAPRR